MRFTLTIDCDNEAFAPDGPFRFGKPYTTEAMAEEVARILKDSARIVGKADFAVLRDISGNTVGKFGFNHDPSGVDAQKLAEAVMSWAQTAGEHGGNPYTMAFVRMARRVLGDA